MYEIKPLEQENIIFICSLMSEPNNIYALHTDIISLDEWQNSFSEAENDADEENFIVYNKDIPCGWLKLNGLKNNDTAWISMLVVSEKFKHQGIGKFTVEFATQYLKHRGYRYIKLQTTTDNSAALSLYSKCGFIIVNQSTTKITMCKEV
ncbi:MAG: GNAT family N-acetyltransferase [Clostridia bacterium]|nr:GNAT family N-acetyltransferase [Clostridia bacterium]